MINFRRLLHKKNRLFPEKLYFKKQKTPACMYLTETQSAELIIKSVEPYLQQSHCDTVLEVNPGIGLLTRNLIERDGFRKILLIETLEHFMPYLQELQEGNSERVQVKHGDVIGLWKLAYQDKIDNGTRVPELLQGVPKRAQNEDTNMVVLGAVGSYNFFKHLVNSLVFQNSLMSYGRCEMFLIVPPPIYIHLTCSNEIGYMIYRSTSILFQMLFEYRFITQVPREHFLPSQTEFNKAKGSKLNRVKCINPEYLYLVRIVPRRDIIDLCPTVDLPALWYFVKQNCVSRRNRVIPNLEKWVPGCGPRLITNTPQKLTKSVQPLYADEDVQKLPKYSTRCTTINCSDYYPNMNIFTQFGDLNASQMLTLFKQFRQWPEYSESSFLASLENSLLKMEASADESIDGISVSDEDDVSGEMQLDNVVADEEILQEEVLLRRKKKSKTVN